MYDKILNEISQPYSDVLNEINELGDDVIVYLMSHVETNEDGKVKRAAAEKELTAIEQELKDKLLQINVKGE